MMYVKLIYRNLKRSTKEYAIYMMTLILSVTLMYAFNGVALSNEVNELARNMAAFAGVSIVSSILIVFVLAWLVYYISKFILEKRSREFGMYMLMGMTRKQVSRMFLLEQVCMGLLAYMIGCVLGIMVYEVMQAIIMNMFSYEFSFQISFSFLSAELTLLYFAMMFVLELIRERHYLKKKSIHELLYSNKKNDVHKANKNRFILFIVFGILLYFAGLKMLDLTFAGIHGNDGLGLLGTVVLIVMSIIFIYLGLSNVITLFINRKRNIKYTGNTLYVSSQICSRLKTSRFVLALLSILTIASFMLVSMGLKFNQAQKDSEAMVPFDIQASQALDDVKLDVSYVSSYLDKQNIKYEDHLYRRYFLPYDARSIVKGIKWENLYKIPGDFTYVGYHDYQTLMKMLGEKPMKMNANEYLIATSSDFEETISKNAKAYSFEGLTFKGCDTRSFGESFYNAVIIIVPDGILHQQTTATFRESYAVKSETPSTMKWYDELLGPFLGHNSQQKDNNDGAEWIQTNDITVKAEWASANLTSTLVFVFTLIYIAIILSCVSATVLAIQQMSDVWKQKKSYTMLWKMGVDKKEIYSILRKQIAVYFFVPFIIPVLYIFPIVRISDQLFAMSYSRSSMVPLTCIAVLFYFVIYSIYYLLAYFNCKHSIQEQ